MTAARDFSPSPAKGRTGVLNTNPTTRSLMMVLVVALGLPFSSAAAQDTRHTLMAVFAHPDDEVFVAPILARHAREGHNVYLVIATDGRLGVRDFAGIPAGDSLAAVRLQEARCGARELGIHPPILLGIPDAGMASHLPRFRVEIARLFAELQPDVVITFGPDGATGHPDHRLVGSVVTEVMQEGTLAWPRALYYVSVPAERAAEAPATMPRIAVTAERYLPVRIPYERRDRSAAVASFACHASQFSPEEQAVINGALEQVGDGLIYLRSWHGGPEERRELFR
jgi:LmbE family N-acetylglucosaminyl deacetylase